MADGVTLPLLVSILFDRKVSDLRKNPKTDGDKRHNLKAVLKSLEKHQALLLSKEYAYHIVEKDSSTSINSTFKPSIPCSNPRIVPLWCSTFQFSGTPYALGPNPTIL